MDECLGRSPWNDSAAEHALRKRRRMVSLMAPRCSPVRCELSTQPTSGTPRRRAHRRADQQAWTSHPASTIACGLSSAKVAPTARDTSHVPRPMSRR